MGEAALAVAALLAAAFEHGAVDKETAAALRQFCGRSGLVASLAVPLDAKQLLCSGNLLERGPLCVCAVPVCGTAAGSTTLAAEAAIFDLETPQRLQDLQLLNLRYHGTSFLCVPVLAHGEAGGSATAEAPAAAADAARGATAAAPVSLAMAPAAGCLTLGFAHDVRRQLPSTLMRATALAAALAPLLPPAAASARAHHAAVHPSGGAGGAAGGGDGGAAMQLWRQNSAASETQALPAHVLLEHGLSGGDSATAAEVAALLQDGDSWLYDSSCGSTADGELDAPPATAATGAAAPTAQPPAPELSPFEVVLAARRQQSGAANAAAGTKCGDKRQRERPSYAASRRRLSREDSCRLVDQALGDLAAADLAAAADPLCSPAFGVAHTATTSATTKASSLISMPSLQTDSVDSLFSQLSCGGGGAFTITLGGAGGAGGGSPIKDWPLASRLAVAVPAASLPASDRGSPRKAQDTGSTQRHVPSSLRLASSPQDPLLASTPELASAASSRSRLQALAAGDSSLSSDLAEAALEAEIWAAEGPAMSARLSPSKPAAAEAPSAAEAADTEAEEAAGIAPQGWLQRAGLGFDDAATEAQFVQWHGLQAQKMDRTALAILLVMWFALGLPPMGLFWHATPVGAMWALGALWALAFTAQQKCPSGYLRHREGVLQAVHFLSLAFGCLNTQFCAQVAASKLASASGALQSLSALSWLQRALLVEAMAVFPLLLWVRVRRAVPLQVANLAMVLATLPHTCASCFAGSGALQLCHVAGAVLLVVAGTIAPLAFMWSTERQSRRTFAWRLDGKSGGAACKDAASGAEAGSKASAPIAGHRS